MCRLGLGLWRSVVERHLLSHEGPFLVVVFVGLRIDVVIHP